MSANEKQAEEVLKTGAILGVVNTLAAPFYWFGAKVGLTVSAIANGATLYLMYDSMIDIFLLVMRPFYMLMNVHFSG